MKINDIRIRRPAVQITLLVALLALLGSAAVAVWPTPRPLTISGDFTSAVGLYPGDAVKVAGVPVGTITAITSGRGSTKITMTVNRDVDIPADAAAVIVAPNLVAARFIELAPVYDSGPTATDGARIPGDRTAVPVEWDQVKDELTKLSQQLGPTTGSIQGPLSRFVNQAADTFDGNGDSFRQVIRELSQTAGRLGDSRTDLLGTVKNLHILVDALSRSNDQIVEFSSHVASVSQVLADSSSRLDTALGTLSMALNDIRGFLKDNNASLVGQVDRLAQFTSLLTQHSGDIEQVLHVAPNGLANFYNIYDPAQASVNGILNLPNFANPVQFICGGVLQTGATPDYYKRAEICRQRMAPVLRRLAANFPPLLFHPINGITAYKGQIVYDTPETEAKAQTPISQLQWQPLPGVTPPVIPPDTDLASLLLPPPAGTSPGPGTAGSNQAAPSPVPAAPAPTPSTGADPQPGAGG
ncbi:MCE family protein [Mycolicibacterium sp. CBMA 226]|uniref:MCE family protein n=1 Tax=Mycolicibacterium sp. CBMA 226 TaxID=2606611 RepID=UPI0012DC80F5|nr:MCE family protein [Mycolicibacterium sp. CBMA 226]MUL74546.1 MCE family protein [Mycolicibacterium sp. CBMA 226]